VGTAHGACLTGLLPYLTLPPRAAVEDSSHLISTLDFTHSLHSSLCCIHSLPSYRHAFASLSIKSLVVAFDSCIPATRNRSRISVSVPSCSTTSPAAASCLIRPACPTRTYVLPLLRYHCNGLDSLHDSVLTQNSSVALSFAANFTVAPVAAPRD
jgi:hypothetical protein